MAENRQQNGGQGGLWLAIEITGALLLAISLAFNGWQVKIYRGQLRQAQIANDQAKQGLEETRKARQDDREQHEREREEDEARLNALQKRSDDTMRRVEEVRSQIRYATQTFIQRFDSAVTIASKFSLDKVPFDQLKSLSANIIDQQKALRDITGLVQADMSTIYNAVDSNIDALNREISAPKPNIRQVRDLVRLITESKERVEGNVLQAREAAVQALGCKQRTYADELPHG